MENGNSSINSTAKVISFIFNPLFIPFYGMLIILFAPTLIWYLPLKVKKILLLVVATNNIFVPVSLFPLLRYRNVISSWKISTRKERIIPLLAASLLYSITSVIMFRLQIPQLIKVYTFSLTVLAIIITMLNFRWKISLHAAGAGLMAGVVLILSLRMHAPLTWILIGAIITGGLILSSRLRLNTCNSAEAYTGYLTGVAGIFILMLLF